MKPLIFYLIIFHILISSSFRIFGQQLNCSAFSINYKKALLGKNLDWEFGNGLVIFNPKNAVKKSVVGQQPLNWKSRFKSITFNHFGKNLPLGGMNDAGLVIEELSSWPVEYPKHKNLNKINEFEWIQFNLDSYSSVAEVIENVDKCSISKFYFDLHYIVADSSGNSAIVEFIDGKATILLNNNSPFLALTNNNYTELLKSYNHYQDSPRTNLNVSQSQDRFIKLTEFLNGNSVYTSFSAMNILDSVKVRDTRWQILYDISDSVIYYKTDLSEITDSVYFLEFNLDDGKYYFINFYSDDISDFRELTTEKNNKYLNSLADIFARTNKPEILLNKINSLIK